MRITTPENDIQRVLFTREQIEARVRELGAELAEEYRGKQPLMVCILKGASVFYADLCRAMDCHLFMDFIAVSSYGASSKSTGVVRIIKDLDSNITGRHVVIVEDIIDSGLTLRYLEELFASRKPASMKTVCLLDKPRHGSGSGADAVGFDIPDEFVVGYGLDYAGHYRNLPYIGVLKKEVYE